jgi:hypothetical protein
VVPSLMPVRTLMELQLPVVPHPDAAAPSWTWQRGEERVDGLCAVGVAMGWWRASRGLPATLVLPRVAHPALELLALLGRHGRHSLLHLLAALLGSQVGHGLGPSVIAAAAAAPGAEAPRT